VDCDVLRDDRWERLEAFVRGGRKGKRGPRANNRRFLNACCGWPAQGVAGAICPGSWAGARR
jgi:hypothetical protein